MLSLAAKKLGLGTVQFGIDYGVSNRVGKTPQKEVESILALAYEAGVKTIDTAHGYGNSEEVLGNAIAPDTAFRIVTKTPRLNTEQPASQIESAFKKSLENLRCSRLYALLIHNYEDVVEENALPVINELLQLKAKGLVEKIGASLYNAEQIDDILLRFTPDIVQVPVNLLDQRLITSGHLKKLKDKGVEIHVRSAFLQGALLMEAESLPTNLIGLKPNLKKLDEYCLYNEISRAAVCLAFLMEKDEVDYVICGVNKASQFQELLDYSENRPRLSSKELAKFAIDDEVLINPALWNK